MADYNGLTRNQWPGTWSPSSDHPIVLDTEIRGGLRYVSGNSGDRLSDITGQRLQDGMVVYVENGYTEGSVTYQSGQYYKYNVLAGESRDASTGVLPNDSDNWEFFKPDVSGLSYDSSSGLITITTSDGNTITDSINLNPFSTTDLSEGNNLYYTTARVDSAFDVRFDSSFDERLAIKSTSDLSEGSNLYYTTARADSDAKNAVSATDAGGDGSFSYNSGTGVFTYTGPSATEARAHMVAGTGVTYDSSTGVISIGQPVGTTDSVDFSHVHADSAAFNYVNMIINDSAPTYREGALWYDRDYHTLNYFGDDSNVTHNLGLEEHQRVFNNTGSTIAKGAPLYFSGNYTSGSFDVPTVGLADATDVNAYNAQGIAAGPIPNNSYGYCLTAGQLFNVDTSHLNAGTNFFVGLGPGLTQNASPLYPNFPMCLGWVVSSDATNGVLLVNQQNHSVRSFRVQTSAHIGEDLQVDGNLTVLGTQTTVGQSNVTQGAPFYRLNEGDAIGEANTTFTGSGLDDAFFAGHFKGTTSQTYYVRIDGEGTGPGGVDTFEVALGNDSTFTSPTETGTAITGNPQLIHSIDNISVEFGSTTGHTSGDRWSGTASPINVDTGFFTNRNTGTSGVGYTHMGFYFDVSDEKWKIIDEYDSTPTGIINVTDSALGILVATSFEGDLTGDVTGNADTATIATNVTASANNSTDETVYLTFVDGATGSQGIETDTGLTYNPSTGVITTSAFTSTVTTASGNAPFTVASTNVVTNLNADKLDDLDATRFLRSDVADVKSSGNLRFGDNVKATFGTGDGDLLIYHDGANSYIVDSGTGNLIVQTGQFQLKNANGNENLITATGQAAVNLYYDNVNRLRTTDSGVTVTGSILADSATISGDVSATTFTGSGANLTNLPAGNLTGTIDSARIPSLAPSDIHGTFATGQIPSLATSKITSGVFDSARIPSLAPSDIHGTFATGQIPSLATSKITSGVFDSARIPTININGGDADTLDGINAAAFLRSNVSDTYSGGQLNIQSHSAVGHYWGLGLKYDGGWRFTNDSSMGMALRNNATAGYWHMYIADSAGTANGMVGNSLQEYRFGGTDGEYIKIGGNTVWHAGNDGTGSTLDADLLDGIQGSSFLRSDAADAKTSGDLTFNDDVKAAFGTGGDMEIYHSSNINRIEAAQLLYLKGTKINFYKAGQSELMASFQQDSSVSLYYDAVKKFETTTYGATVTGTIDADSASVNILNIPTGSATGNRIQVGDDLLFYDDGNAHIHGRNGTLWINNQSNGQQVRINNQYNGDVILTNGTGNVGIGTTSPTSQLHVAGTIRSTDSAIFDGDGSTGGITISDGLIDMRTGTGNVSKIKFYCETNNAHFQTLQAQPHSAGSSAVITLPQNTGTLALTSQIGLLDHHSSADSAAILTVGGTGSLTGVSGAFTVDQGIDLSHDSSQLSTLTQTAIASFSSSTYTGGKLLITAHDHTAGSRQISELLVLRDSAAGTAHATEYGQIYTSGVLATYDVDINGGNIRVLATSTSTNATTYQVAETLMRD